MRVHLAIPEKEVFVRDTAEPTASVFLQLARGRSLGRSQVEAIVHLVSSSVPNLTKENVAVVDQNGALLSRSADSLRANYLTLSLNIVLSLKIFTEPASLRLTPIVGAGNINAQINLDIDFTRSEVTEEVVDPNGNALRSEQSTNDQTCRRQQKEFQARSPNTPPEAAQLSSTATASGGSSELKSSSSSEVKNYEVSRTVSSTLKPSNIIRKINAAVLVRQPDVIDPETGLSTSQAMSEEDLARIEKLVADAIGIDT